jgi:hypothetical protein
MTVELMQANNQFENVPFNTQMLGDSSSFSLSDYADRYNTARDAYLQVFE